jgi:mono/diheme cytochrome c family protein
MEHLRFFERVRYEYTQTPLSLTIAAALATLVIEPAFYCHCSQNGTVSRGSSMIIGLWRAPLRACAGIVTAFYLLVPQTPALPDGKTIFNDSCAACHTIGGGNSVGPDLAGIAQRRSADWILRFIREPDRVIAAKDPTALALLKQFGGVAMPNLGLSSGDVEAVAAYIEAPGGSAAASQATASPAAAPVGDVRVGRELFDGNRRLQAGGPQCMACHSVAGLGLLGGGALGPELTPAFRKYGAQGLVSVLQSVPFPTMAPLYAGHPLSAQEGADISAFLQVAGSGVARDSLIPILTFSIDGLVGLYMLLSLLWRGRLRSVRESLLPR